MNGEDPSEVNKLRVAVFLLSASLISSNAWWAYRSLDDGITHTYFQQECNTKSVLLTQTLSVLPVVAKPKASEGEILAAAQLQNSRASPFEKNGFVWVGQLGLQFNDEGQLIKAVAGLEAVD